MNEFRVQVDVSEVNSLLSQLENNKDRKAAINSGLRRSANIIRKQAIKNMLQISPAFKDLKAGVHVKVYKNSSGARIDILGYGKGSERTFVLPFFNQGTKLRTTKTGKKRGSIARTDFFTSAVNEKQKEAEHSLEANIKEFIRRRIARNNARR